MSGDEFKIRVVIGFVGCRGRSRPHVMSCLDCEAPKASLNNCSYCPAVRSDWRHLWIPRRRRLSRTFSSRGLPRVIATNHRAAVTSLGPPHKKHQPQETSSLSPSGPRWLSHEHDREIKHMNENSTSNAIVIKRNITVSAFVRSLSSRRFVKFIDPQFS